MSAPGPARRLAIWLGGLVVFCLALYVLRAVLLPFVAGMAVAYMFDPIVDRIERAGVSRTLATVIVTAAFFLVVIVVAAALLPLIESELVALVKSVPHFVDIVRDETMRLVQRVAFSMSPDDVQRVRAAMGDFAGKAVAWLGSVLGGLWSGGLALVNLLSLVFITPVVTFYLLRDWERIVHAVDGWLPRDHAATIRELMREIDTTLAGFARGQALVCLFLGTFYSVGLLIVGLQFGLVVGIGAGLLSFVPFIGTLGGFVAALALAFFQFSDWRWIAATAAVFVAGHLIEANLLSPKLIGDRVGLHPVWVIFALLAGAALLGFVGILLAVPVAASVGVLARFTLKQYLAGPLYDRKNGTPSDPR
ncbi:MAG TPA: AI-2E family transporter [Alphaproteobacteria bacterium]|nr:AI-2E family transporter [Alphaproteobacteria bacterium]